MLTLKLVLFFYYYFFMKKAKSRNKYVDLVRKKLQVVS